MLTGKQRSYLKGIGNSINSIFQIGKNGINDNFIKQIDSALEAREIIKVNVLKNSFLDVTETAYEVANLTESEVVQSIGNKFILYRESKDNKRIELP